MKTNKAPEKIYLYTSDIPDQEYEAEWGCQPWDESSVEYTRTDAFIDKACEWLEPVFKDLAGYNCGGDLIEDFKQAMKVE